MILYSKKLLMLHDDVKVDKILPQAWGKLKSFGVSVNADDKNRTETPKRSFCFVTDIGAFAVCCDYDTIIPTKEEILSANFVVDVFNNKYNGAFYTTPKNSETSGLPVNGWYPAKYEEWSDRIVWLYDEVVVRNIRKTSLAIWGWKSEYLNVGKQYSYKIIDDKMLIYYQNNLILTLY